MAPDENGECERSEELRRSFAEVCGAKNWKVHGNRVLELVTLSGIRLYFSVHACSEESGGCDVFIRLPDKKKVKQVDRLKNAQRYYNALNGLPDEVKDSMYESEGNEVFMIRVSKEEMNNADIAKSLFEKVKRFVDHLIRLELTAYCEIVR